MTKSDYPELLPVHQSHTDEEGHVLLAVLALLEMDRPQRDFAPVLAEFIKSGIASATSHLHSTLDGMPLSEKERIVDDVVSTQGEDVKARPFLALVNALDSLPDGVRDNFVQAQIPRSGDLERYSVQFVQSYLNGAQVAYRVLGMVLAMQAISGKVRAFAQSADSNPVWKALIYGDVAAKPTTIVARQTVHAIRKHLRANKYKSTHSDRLFAHARWWAIITVKYGNDLESAFTEEVSRQITDKANLSKAIAPFNAAIGLELLRGRKANEVLTFRVAPTQDGAFRSKRRLRV